MIWSGLSQGDARLVAELAQTKTHSSTLAVLSPEILPREADRSKDGSFSGGNEAAYAASDKASAQRKLVQPSVSAKSCLGRRAHPCGSNLARAPPRPA